ncbi:hypothetical protein BC628DRAFT_1417474 [Trametes gibbosa]|nr:hypothetical protein BC628DRAFT_1417474 [Trametes gibbosa]
MAQQNSFYNAAGLSFGFDVAGNLSLPSSYSQPLLGSQSGSLSNLDLNSPEVFKQNIQIIQNLVSRIQVLTRSAIAGIEQAYHQDVNPVQTATLIDTLKRSLLELVEALRTSGVGALPLEPPPVPDPRTDEQLLAEATRTVQALYERQRRIQEGASVVTNLLGATDQPASSQGSQGAGGRR